MPNQRGRVKGAATTRNLAWTSVEATLLLLGTLLLLAFVGVERARGQGPQCPPGFEFQPNSGVGCVQIDCFNIANAYLSYTGQCICAGGFKACTNPADYSGFDSDSCGPFCPSAQVVACVGFESACPMEAPPSSNGAEEQANKVDAGATDTDIGAAGTRSSISDLARDLERFLTEASPRGPSAAGAAVSGAAVSSLIATWLLVNLLSGESPAGLLRAIRDWRAGQASGPSAASKASEAAASAGAEVDPAPEAPSAGRIAAEAATRRAERSVEAEVKASSPSPAGEDVEAAAHRRAKDAADVVDALDKTLKDAKDLRDRLQRRIPPNMRDNEQIKIFFDRFDKILQKTRDVTRLEDLQRVVKTLNDHFKMHEAIDQDLGKRLPKDARQAIKLLQSTMKATGDALMDTYDRLVHDPLTGAGEKALKPFSKELAGRFRKEMEAQQKALQEVKEGLAKLPSQAARVATNKRFGEYWREAEVNNPEARDIQGPGAFKPTERPDFGKGVRKAEGWYRSFRKWLGKTFWQFREIPPVP